MYFFSKIAQSSFSAYGIVIGKVFILIILSSYCGLAQDFEKIGKDKPLKISGSLSATGISYTSNGLTARRPPLSYFLAGNININLYGWSIPFSATYSNQEAGFRQPFNQYGVSPKYKWITLHAGYRTMIFSPYTLNGHIFLGGGVELAPSNFRLSAMYGRLNKATAGDTLNAQAGDPSFERYGFGVKAGYEKDRDNIFLVIFKAKDNINSLSYISEEREVLPAENLVYGISGRKKLSKKIIVVADYARSAYTRDIRNDVSSTETILDNRLFSNLITTRTSTSFLSALKVNLNYTGKGFSLQTGYERVDPEYRTLGAYFFNNDFENMTVGGAKPLFKNKVNLAVNGGVQRNNILNTEVNSMKRVIGGANISYTPNERWNFNGNYSNYTVNTRIRPAYDQFTNLDTLNLTQITRNGNLSSLYNFGSKENSKNLSLNLSYQTANNNKGDKSPVTESTFLILIWVIG